MRLATIQTECLNGVSARAVKGMTAWGEGRSVRSLRVDDSTIGVTTDSSNRVKAFSFETTGPVAMAADKAERPSSGAKLARMIRPIRTEVLPVVILALPPSSQTGLYLHFGQPRPSGRGHRGG